MKLKILVLGLLLFAFHLVDAAVVAVVDTGVDGTHPDLYGKVVHEACFAIECPQGAVGPGTAAPCGGPSCWHGTHVAGTVLANAPGAELAAIQVFAPDGSFTEPTWPDRVSAALDHIGTLPDIAAVNISVAGAAVYPTELECSFAFPQIEAAAAALVAQGIAVVAASGNNGASGVSGPACVPSITSVAAVDEVDVLYAQNNQAPFLDYLAVGVDVTGPVPGGGYLTDSGTSHAAPQVTGTIAAMGGVLVEDSLVALTVTGVPVEVSSLQCVAFGQCETIYYDIPRIDSGRAIDVFSLPDSDADGFGDAADNCTLVANGPDAPDVGGNIQLDADGDGYGNFCDPDLDQNGVVTTADFTILRAYLGTSHPPADLDGSGLVDADDWYNVMLPMMFLPPGPSGIAP